MKSKLSLGTPSLGPFANYSFSISFLYVFEKGSTNIFVREISDDSFNSCLFVTLSGSFYEDSSSSISSVSSCYFI